jgi:hypothetical protein
MKQRQLFVKNFHKTAKLSAKLSFGQHGQQVGTLFAFSLSYIKGAFGLSFSQKITDTDYQGGVVISYILDETYNDALAIITAEIGEPHGSAGL